MRMPSCSRLRGALLGAIVLLTSAAHAEPPAPAQSGQQDAPRPPGFANLRVSAVDAGRTPGLVIEWDGVPIAEADLGRLLPVGAGEHTLAASAPGRQTWRITVIVQSAGVTTDVAVPTLAPAEPPAAPPLAPVPVAAAPIAAVAAVLPPAPAGVPAGNTAAPQNGVPSSAPPAESGPGPQHVLALVSGGLGVAFVTVGIVAGLNARSRRDEARAHCTGAVCHDKEGLDLTTRAVNDGNLATAGLIAGAVGIAGGFALWFTAPSPTASPTRVGVGLNRVMVQGAF